MPAYYLRISDWSSDVCSSDLSLAHRGVLFLDELPEFSRQALDSLRQPLESGAAVVARAEAHVTYPARLQLIAAMNPCRCGHLGDAALARSEGGGGGKEGVRTCRFRGAPVS